MATKQPDLEIFVQQLEQELDTEIAQITTKQERFAHAAQDGRNRAQTNNNTQPVRTNRSKRNDYVYLLDGSLQHNPRLNKLLDMVVDQDPISVFESLQNGSINTAMTLLTE